MQKIIKKFNIVVLLAAVVYIFLGSSVAEAKVFNLHLYFDSSKNEIYQDRESAENIKLLEGVYTFDENDISGDYYFKTVNHGDEASGPTYFIPQEKNFVLEAPYFQEMANILIYNGDKLLLDIDVSKFATCNNNKICEAGLGENAGTCVSDCFKDEMNKILEESKNNNTPVIVNNNGEESSDPLTGINNNSASTGETDQARTPYFGLIVGSLLLLGGVGYGVWKLIKSRRVE